MGVQAAVWEKVARLTWGRGNPLSVQSSAWSENAASTLALREPVNVRTPDSGE